MFRVVNANVFRLRALATDARVLLFDDSFSALDYATDAKLRHALSRNAAGKTVIVVAQRISTVLNADKIVVLEEGKMVGCVPTGIDEGLSDVSRDCRIPVVGGRTERRDEQ